MKRRSLLIGLAALPIAPLSAHAKASGPITHVEVLWPEWLHRNHMVREMPEWGSFEYVVEPGKNSVRTKRDGVWSPWKTELVDKYELRVIHSL